MKDTLKLLSFHLRMLPCAVTIAYQFRSSLVNKGGSEPQLEWLPTADKGTRIKPLSNDSVRHIRRQNTHTAGGSELEPTARKHVVPTYLPLDHLPPYACMYVFFFSFF
jgi:hypothetical protein